MPVKDLFKELMPFILRYFLRVDCNQSVLLQDFFLEWQYKVVHRIRKRPSKVVDPTSEIGLFNA